MARKAILQELMRPRKPEYEPQRQNTSRNVRNTSSIGELKILYLEFNIELQSRGHVRNIGCSVDLSTYVHMITLPLFPLLLCTLSQIEFYMLFY